MKSFIYFLAFIVAGGLFLPGCSDENFYEPGADTNPNSPQIYFDSSNPGVGGVTVDEDYLLIAISRLKTQSALTVPVHVTYSAKGLSFPDQSVSFAAGEETAYFRVGYDREVLELEVPYRFGLTMDHENTDPYNSMIPGTAKYDGSLKRLEPWVLITKTKCVFEATGGTTKAEFGPFEQNLYKKEIAGLYMFENWCLNNTGEEYGNLVFTVNSNKQVLPDPAYGFHDTAQKRWYFYMPGATSDNDYPTHQINGHLPNEKGIYMTYFYLYAVGSSSAVMDFDEEGKTATLRGYSRYSKTYSSGAFLLHYTW